MSIRRHRNDKYEVRVVNRTRQHIPLAFFERTAREALAVLAANDAAVGVVFVGEGAMRSLVRRYRQGKKATNVLSFSYHEKKRPQRIAGDIVLCVPVVKREVTERGETLRGRLATLLVHGMVHLAGFTHGNDHAERNMLKKERAIARRMPRF